MSLISERKAVEMTFIAKDWVRGSPNILQHRRSQIGYQQNDIEMMKYVKIYQTGRNINSASHP